MEDLNSLDDYIGSHFKESLRLEPSPFPGITFTLRDLNYYAVLHNAVQAFPKFIMVGYTAA